MTAPTIGGDLSHTHRDVMSLRREDPPISVEDMLELEKLITVDQARDVLGRTEPLAYVSFDLGDQVRFRVNEGWNSELALATGNTPVDAFVTFQDGLADGVEYQLSLDGLRQAAKQVGYGRGLLERAPGYLTEDQLNYWFRGGLDNRKLKLMVVGQEQLGVALVRDSIEPFSNLGFLDRALERIQARWPEGRVLVDCNKLAHTLSQTYLQLVLPDVARVIDGTGEVDDRWWGGLQIANALDGSLQTRIDAFMFRQRCTNGMIEQAEGGGSWSRKSGGQDQDAVLAWAEGAVDEALGQFDGIFDRVQQMVGLKIDPNNMGATAQDLFEQYSIPVAARRRVVDNLVEADQMNMYGLVNAVTAAANGDVPAAQQQTLMIAGGETVRHAERCTGCHRMLPDGMIGFDAHDH